MSCGEPCDGCINRAEHHLCGPCSRADIDRLRKDRDMYRDEATRQMEYGIKQHEFAQDALRERDEARAEVERLRGVVRKVHALAAIEEQDYRCVRVVENLREIHKLTKGMEE